MRIAGAFLVLVAAVVLIPIVLSVAKWLLVVITLLSVGVVCLKFAQMQKPEDEEDENSETFKDSMQKTWKDLMQLYHGRRK